LITMKSEDLTKEHIDDLEDQLLYIAVLELELDKAELEGRGCEVGETKRAILKARKEEVLMELEVLRGS